MGTILRAAFAYVFLLLILRMTGRRSLSGMTPLEFILLFVIGGMMIQAVVSDDRSMTNACLAAITIGGMNVLITTIKYKSPRMGMWIDGTPLVIVKDGKLNEDLMRKLRILEDDIMTTAREKGIDRVEQINCAIVERNGRITIR